MQPEKNREQSRQRSAGRPCPPRVGPGCPIYARGDQHMHAQTARHLRMLALTLVVGLAGVAVLSGSATAAVPAPPAGFTLTWSDDFSGASGTGRQLGQLAVRHRHGHLRHRRDRDDDEQHGERLPGRRRAPRPPRAPQRDEPGDGLDVGPDRDAVHQLRRSRRRRRPDAVVDPAAEREHEQRPRLLAGVLDARRAAAQRCHLADLGRGRHPRGHQRTQLGLRDAALRRQPRRPVQRDDGARQRRARVLRLPDRVPHLRRADRPLGVAGADPLVPRRRRTTSR